MKPAIVPLVGRLEHPERAGEMGEHAAAVDVADHQHRQIGGAGKAHIGDVAVAQIDLGRAAGALADDDVEPRAELARGCR